jgi:hypothetical protein
MNFCEGMKICVHLITVMFMKSHVRWVPCHHGMVRPQAVDGSPPGMEGSCEYIE